MNTEFFLRGALDEIPPFYDGLPPDPTTFPYYQARTTFWYLTNDTIAHSSPNVDTDQTCTEGDIITPDTLHRALWYYKVSTNELFIPLQNAHIIIEYLYKTAVPVNVAHAWLRTLEFSKRYSKVGTCSLYAGVTFTDCEPHAGRNARCIVLDMSQPDERAVKDEDVWEMQDKASEGDVTFAKPYSWRKRNDPSEPQLDGLTDPQSPNSRRVVTDRAKRARYTHANRMAKLYGRSTKEFEDAMRLYDEGVRKPRHRVPTDIRHTAQINVVNFVRKLAHPQNNLFFGDLNGAHRSGNIASDSSSAPIVHPSSLLAPTHFHSDILQQPYDVANRPIAWAIDTREVRVPASENTYELRSQVTRVAINEIHLEREMANYSQALHYVTNEEVRNPVTKHMDKCAVFDITHQSTGKLRQRRASPTTLTSRVEELEAKVDKLGKAFHALMGIIKDMQG